MEELDELKASLAKHKTRFEQLENIPYLSFDEQEEMIFTADHIDRLEHQIAGLEGCPWPDEW